MIRKKNVTPAHEYFHQIQNSVSYFKNAWYYEGLARWSEDSLISRKRVTEDLIRLRQMLDNDTELTDLYNSNYNAAQLFWQPFATLLGNEMIFPAKDPIVHAKYTDGSAVMKDFSFFGAHLISNFLKLLGDADKRAFREQNYDVWSEKNQRNEANNLYIVRALKEFLDTRDFNSR